jgi:hypothetical protein
MMSDLQKAKDVLVKARQEILHELIQCGSNGGVGRAGNYAPSFVNLTNAIAAVDGMMSTSKVKTTEDKTAFAERMAAARKAKAKA